MKNSNDKDEVRLEKLSKSLLAMPTKPRADSKIGRKKIKNRAAKKSKATK